MDRNTSIDNLTQGVFKSLSARRAWIEIPAGCWRDARRAVALRKESVDRNFYYADKDADWVRSLSARRAWIEIRHTWPGYRVAKVALRKESVDRNSFGLSRLNPVSCRSPQGERG